MTTPTLLFDMDETVFQMSERICSILSEHLGHKVTSKEYWWKDLQREYGLSQRYFEYILNQPETFRDLQLHENAKEVLDKLVQDGYNVCFVTAPQFNNYCVMEKIYDLQKNFVWFDARKHVILTWAKDLVEGILYDDLPDNLEAFRMKGKKCICYPQSYNEGISFCPRLTWNEYYQYITDQYPIRRSGAW